MVHRKVTTMSAAHSDAIEAVQAIDTTASPTSSSSDRTELVPVDTDAHMLVQSDNGRFIIHREVVAKIIGLAVREVPGVHELAPFGTGERIARLADRITGHDTRDLGVQVEIGTIECAADVRVVCNYGVSLPEVGSTVRERGENR